MRRMCYMGEGHRSLNLESKCSGSGAGVSPARRLALGLGNPSERPGAAGETPAPLPEQLPWR
jgi:hypothetical protein